MKILKKVTVFFAFVLCYNAFARDIYVAKDGDDANPGTMESPYLTLGKAASEAVAGDIVYIREGVYEEILSPVNSGTAGSPIIFQSFPGEKVVISAMEALSGWIQDSGSIYKTTISFNSLGQENFVVNDKTPLNLARWPNKTTNNPFVLNSIRNTGGSDGDVINGAYLTESSIPAIDWTGGALWFYGDRPGSGWTAWKRAITSSTAGRVNFTFSATDAWVRTFHPPADLGDFYLEGVKAALDYENEWYFDNSTKTLYVQLPGGAAPEDGKVHMRRRLETINLKDKKYIEIRNLAVYGGNINMEDSSTWQANGNNRTTNNILYGVSVFYANHTQGVVDGSRTGKASIKLQGSNNTIERCEIAFNSAAGIDARGNNQTIIDNYIHDFDFLACYDGPLVVRGINNSIVKNNTVFNGGRDAIQYFGETNEISFNDVSKSNRLADDCALFYTVGPRATVTEIHHNWFHDTDSPGTKSKAAGIYLDNDASNYLVHHNVVWNTEWTNIQINWNGEDINIYNNTLWNGSEVMGAWHLAGTQFSNVNVWNNLGSDNNWEPQSDKQNNLVVEGTVFNNLDNGDFTLKQSSSPIDMGRQISGVTDGFVGSNPDVGAYEFGGDNWVAGITWDPTFGPTGSGCYNLPGEDCLVIPDDDLDVDGVKNEFDECPDTPLGATVNAKGCEIFILPANNFSVLIKGEECAVSDNGSVTITSVTSEYDFSATIEGTSTKQDFNSSTTFQNLAAGDYTICITTTEDANYKQCFDITITEPEGLSVTSKVNSDNKSVTYNMSGSSSYTVNFNGEQFLTTDSSIELYLQTGNNSIAIKGEKDCQGEFKESLFFNEIVSYPNPFINGLTIDLGLEKSASLRIYNTLGALVYEKHYTPKNHKIELDTSFLKAGIYVISVETAEISKKIKALKI